MALEKLMALDDRPVSEIQPDPLASPKLRRTTAAGKPQALLADPIPQTPPEEALQDEQTTPNLPTPYRKTRIIQSRSAADPDAPPKPELHLTGDYHTRSGFGVGRVVDVLVEKDKITIVPTDPNAPPVDVERVKKIMSSRAEEARLLKERATQPTHYYDLPARGSKKDNRKEARKKSA